MVFVMFFVRGMQRMGGLVRVRLLTAFMMVTMLVVAMRVMAVFVAVMSGAMMLELRRLLVGFLRFCHVRFSFGNSVDGYFRAV